MTTKAGRLTFSPPAQNSIKPCEGGRVITDQINHDIGVEQQHNLCLTSFGSLPQLTSELDAIADVCAVLPHADERRVA
jgi:hypothetical protein